MMRIRSVRQPAAALLLCLQLGNCSSWRVETAPAAELIAKEQPATVRITRSNGQRQVLHQPAVQGDSLVGSHAAGMADRDRAVALADVTAVATRHRDAGKTLLLGIGIAAVLGGVIAFSVGMSDCCGLP
ncbi:MAG TPA: hypothetical protein VFN40_04900 [Gemmatimonadales bacterium]|nr:hypothetical protein [Gemmatimonadales bacterium]